MLEECLDQHGFVSIEEARTTIEAWVPEDDSQRPRTAQIRQAWAIGSVMVKDITMQETTWPRYEPWIARISRPLLVFEIAMLPTIVFLLDPLVMALLQAIVASSSDPYAGNAALITFFVSPVGLLTAVTGAVIFVFLAALEFGGVSLIAWDGMHGQRSSLSSVWIRLFPRLPAGQSAAAPGHCAGNRLPTVLHLHASDAKPVRDHPHQPA